MNKQSFMTQLKRELEPLKQSSRQEILADMEEHYVNGQASGKAETQVSEELGDPKELAREYILEAQEDEKRMIAAGQIGRSVLAAIGLFLLDVMIMIPIFASLFAVVISLWTIPLSLVASSLFISILPLLNFSFVIPYGIGILIAISLLGLAIAMSVGLIYVSKYFLKAVVSYAKAHYNIIRGGRRYE